MKINKYNDFKKVFGSIIRELRLKLNLSQQDLAEKKTITRCTTNFKGNIKN